MSPLPQEASALARILRAQPGFDQLPDADFAELSKAARPLRLRPGQKLFDYGALPPGLAVVATGLLRLLARDERENPFTLQRVGPGEMVGHLSLVRGTTGLAVAAAQPTQLWVIPQPVFLAVYARQPLLQKALAGASAEEFYAVASLSPSPINPERERIRDWAQEFCREHADQLAVELLPPGDHSFGAQWGPWLVSSSNVEGCQPGEELLGPVQLRVKGKLPARLLPKSPSTPPPHAAAAEASALATEADVEELSTSLVAVEEQQEALQDWYGSSDQDGSFPHLSGSGDVEAPMACLRMLARFYDLPFRRDVLKRILEDQLRRDSENQGISLLQFAAISDVMGLRAAPIQLTPEQMPRVQFPALAVGSTGPVVLWDCRHNGQLLVGDPASGQEHKPLADVLNADDEGRYEILLIERSSKTPTKRFGLSWFLPALKEHQGVLIQVLVASFFVQLFGLLNPLLIQQIIDAVISQGNVSTLNVLGTLLVAMGLSQAVLSALRTYLFSDTTNRIDVSLGSAIMGHLMRLPLSYFADRPVGEVSSRINELEKIRRFLTSTALTVILDALFALIYIAVMLLYSVQLTFWALAVVPFFVGVTIVSSPLIRSQLRDQAEANAKVQSHLVESLGGMETLKGQNMELQSQWRWQNLYTSQIQSGFRNVVTSTAAGSASQFLEQLSGLLVLWVGASLVLAGEMTLGQLIAFRILAGYVTNPLLRLANLWQNFQETALSMERLADIVDHPEELEIVGEQKPPIPPLRGEVDYAGVSFRFIENRPLQLSNVEFKIPAGSFVGVVGSSGSGKSTLLKLLTRLYEPSEGVIRIDGHDISKVDLYSLRAQIGVVPQDSLLFDGSVHSNIALTRPDASFEEVQEAAKLACAHEFVETLPAGYSSNVGERGAGLSGGQRQRLAIARMILRRPRLLVLDEATSALDVDTERRLTSNLMRCYKGRTVFFITHRLISLSQADTILVMNQGALVEHGTHAELMDLGGRYSTLYQQQANPFQLSSEEPYDVEFRVPEFQGDGPQKSMPAPAAASLPSQDPAPAPEPPEQPSAPQVEADASELKPAPELELDSEAESDQEMAVSGFETPAAPPVAAEPVPEHAPTPTAPVEVTAETPMSTEAAELKSDPEPERSAEPEPVVAPVETAAAVEPEPAPTPAAPVEVVAEIPMPAEVAESKPDPEPDPSAEPELVVAPVEAAAPVELVQPPEPAPRVEVAPTMDASVPVAEPEPQPVVTIVEPEPQPEPIAVVVPEVIPAGLQQPVAAAESNMFAGLLPPINSELDSASNGNGRRPRRVAQSDWPKDCVIEPPIFSEK